ncbi:MAG: ATP-dependent protease LonB [Firmicutes bacterium]|jgi:Lon-like ATP-dependent protease|nr:ATP-dependent protease LonB [Candidatus Fermentithermobacillaceae bacterium]
MNSGVLVCLQLVFTAVMGLYLWNLLKSQEGRNAVMGKESRKELERLKQLRQIRLSEPLTERTRPRTLDEVIGQAEGIKALRAALCGPNPQHVILYGPPGVGKTAAARLVLEEAKKNPASPFKSDAVMVEVDATIVRFDERGIADPLIGSVHDPIYQGAGALGIAGVPRPKPGAVSRAHGGILFLDEIGELHPAQMQKLLKVLEDRRVFFESAYYSRDNPNIPEYVHDIFQNGLPADFRLVGATTSSPEDIPPALRSRCLEIFFRALSSEEIGLVAQGAAQKAGVDIEPQALEVIKRYAQNGREAVNFVQLGAGLVAVENRKAITLQDAEWIVSQGRYSMKPEIRVPKLPVPGLALGLAVSGPGTATVIEVESQAIPTQHTARGRVTVTGVIEEEQLGRTGHTYKRKSMVASSVENVITALACHTGIRVHDYDLHVDFPGGTPVDGPSAGLAIAMSICSTVTGTPITALSGFSGEVSVRGEIRAVGGIEQKLCAAEDAGLRCVYIPEANWQERYVERSIQVVPVRSLVQCIELVFSNPAMAIPSGLG